MWFYQVIPWRRCKLLIYNIWYFPHTIKVTSLAFSCVFVYLCNCVLALNFASGMQEYLSCWNHSVNTHIKCVPARMLQLMLKANLHNVNVKQRVWVKSRRGSGILWPEATLHKAAATALDVTERLCKAVNWIENKSVSYFPGKHTNILWNKWTSIFFLLVQD